LAVAGHGKDVRIWDAATGKELHRLQARSVQVHQLCYSPDGKAIALTNFNGNSIEVWEPDSGRDKVVVENLVDEDRTPYLAYAPDGKLVATGTVKGVIQLRDVVTWEVKAAAAGHSDGILGLTFSPDGKLLATAGADRMARLWDVRKLVQKGMK
jgi:WD40 repeat protein